MTFLQLVQLFAQVCLALSSMQPLDNAVHVSFMKNYLVVCSLLFESYATTPPGVWQLGRLGFMVYRKRREKKNYTSCKKWYMVSRKICYGHATSLVGRSSLLAWQRG